MKKYVKHAAALALASAFLSPPLFAATSAAHPAASIATGVATVVAPADAHEGPVYVASQNRLYFTSKRGMQNGIPNVSINYLDLTTLRVSIFVENANMANGMFLANDGKHLLVAEQGNMKTHTPGGISSIDLTTGEREMLVNSYKGKPFNSPNKVIQSKNGLIYFSDPDYGYNQGFKPQPALPNAIYVFNPKTRQITVLTTQFIMPHGLAFADHDHTLIVGDTGAIDGKHPYNPNSTHDLYAVKLKGDDQVASVTHLMTVSPGIPDGFVVVGSSLYVAAGDGVGRYTLNGKLVAKYPIPTGAVNLTVANGVLLVTADEAIYQIKL